MEADKKLLTQFIKNALAEDIGDGDHTSLSTIPQGKQGKARLIIKERGVLAGITVAKAIFNEVDSQLNVTILINDGAEVEYGDVALFVSGRVHSILVAERLVLNTMQMMSGIASTTKRISDLIKGTGTKVLDTRKTSPNLRFLQKLAVKIGGGENHRIGLFDMILIKDNHVDYAGGIAEAIKSAIDYRDKLKKHLEIEIEVRTLNELDKVLETGGVDRILLDNFSYENLREAVRIVAGRFKTEASGGITEENALEFAACGVDYISMGALTHSVKSLDMSLKAFDGDLK
jgi:nicotinate-nucleotide pyrophosphorylase (carboxylating)